MDLAAGTTTTRARIDGVRAWADRVTASRDAPLRVLSLLVVGSVWEAWGRANPLFASYPTAIIGAFGQVFLPAVIPALVTTTIALGVGLATAIPLGMVIGFAMGRSRLLDVILTPYVNAIYATPRISLIPILVLWLGIDFNLRVTIVALGAIFPVIVNTYAGSKAVDPDLLDAGRAFMADRFQVLRTIVVPSALPYLFAGIRVGFSRGISGVIVAEMTSALTGIGQLLIAYGKYLLIDQLFVAIMALGFFSLLCMGLLARTQRRLMPWAHGEGGP